MFDSRGGKIKIGNFVDISPEVNIWTLQHDYNDPHFGTKGADVEIDDYVWVGNRVTILPGIHVGMGAVLAAGSVVTKNVPEWTVVAGVPAKPIGKRPSDQFPRKPYNPFLL
ncbi:MAG: acyltransferase [Bacteroidota bacterium]|nr:acyltransferase [Bacteroidota bacterium]